MNFPEISSRAFNTPLLVHPGKAAAFVRGFGPRLFSVDPDNITTAFEDGGDIAARSAPAFASLLGDEMGAEIRDGDMDGYTVVSGIAVIPVSGVLVHRGSWIGNSSGQTSYEGLRAQIDGAAADARVSGIALEIDSFGGEVSGCFDLADRIRTVAAKKPVWAFVAENAYSAAYALAAQATKIVVPRTGGVGSIGVVTMHVDVSKALVKEGVTVTMIHAGAHKVDGHSFAPLPEAVYEELQGEMEKWRALFASTVAAGRGNRLSAKAALATEARCFSGEDAVAAGFADEVAEPRAAFRAFIRSVTSKKVQVDATGASATGGLRMAKRITAKSSRTRAMEDEDEDVVVPVEDEDDLAEDGDEPAEDEDQIEPDAEDDDEDELAEGEGDDEDEDVAPVPASARRERARIGAIVNSPEAKANPALARHLAFNTSTPSRAAIKTLKAAGSSGRGSLTGAMRHASGNKLSPAGSGGGKRGPSCADLARKKYGLASPAR